MTLSSAESSTEVNNQIKVIISNYLCDMLLFVSRENDCKEEVHRCEDDDSDSSVREAHG